MKSILANERGVILVISLLILALLIGAGVGAIVSMQTDLRISSNLKTGKQALYIADAGIERGKQWLNANQSGPFPTTINEDFGAGSYAVTIDRFTPGTDDGRYRVTGTGSGPNNSTRVIEAIMKRPGFNPFAAINIDGDGTHADFDDGSGGTGNKIPNFNVDGRDHTADGTSLAPIATACDPVSPFAATDTGSTATPPSSAASDLTSEADDLRKRIVKRANHNSFCGGNPPDPAGPCTPGLYYVKDQNLTDRDSDCPGTQCYENLDLSAPELRATAVETSSSPPIYTLPAAPDDRGPFAPITIDDPLVKELNATEKSELQQAIQDIIDLSNASPASKKNCINDDIRGGTHTYGTSANPMITYIGDPCSANPTYEAGGRGRDLDVRDGAVVNGAGILIVPRRIRLRDATFNWQGIVLVLEDGDFRVDGASDETTCGGINGSLILQDDSGNDPKVDMDKVGPGSASCRPFSVNFSCEANNNALKLLLKQVSWVDQF